MPRRNGCQCPWRAEQTIAFVLWWGIVAGCYGLVIPVLQGAAAQAGVAAGYSAAVLGVAATYIFVCATDPADTACVDGQLAPLFCDRCQRHVQNGSKHCKICNQCTAGFDHHCKWTNCCIGSANYRAFLGLVSSLVAMLALQMGAGVALAARCFASPADADAALSHAYAARVRRPAYAAGLLVYCCLVAAALYPLLELWMLHVVLLARGMTTYQFILLNRERALEPSALSRAAARLRRAWLCVPAGARVWDEAAAAAAAAAPHQVTRARVGINPCLACTTHISAPHAPPQQPAVRDASGSPGLLAQQQLRASGGGGPAHVGACHVAISVSSPRKASAKPVVHFADA